MWKWLTNFLGSFAKIFSNPSIRSALNFLTPIAVDVVSAIAKDTSILSSIDKRNAAAQQIAEKVKAANPPVNITNSLINLALEIAVQQIKH